MGILDWIRGTDEPREQRQSPPQPYQGSSPAAGSSEDEQALARYRYMLKTAPPETIEQAHAEAFARLTPEQRRRVLQELSAVVPEAERAAAAQGGDAPQSLARMATRAEMRQPGTLERTFGGLGGGMGGGMGFGGLMAGSFFSAMAGTVLGSMIAHQFFASDTGFAGGDHGGGHDQESGADAQDNEGDYTADNEGTDMEGGDVGGDMGGDFGGDF